MKIGEIWKPTQARTRVFVHESEFWRNYALRKVRINFLKNENVYLIHVPTQDSDAESYWNREFFLREFEKDYNEDR